MRDCGGERGGKEKSYEKRRDEKIKGMRGKGDEKESKEQRKRKAVRVLLSRIKRGDRRELKAPRPSARSQWRRSDRQTNRV